MGIELMSSDSYKNEPSKSYNPKPNNWVILDYEHVNSNLVVKIKYPDCLNYEGVKILVYIGLDINELKRQKLIDPHFSDNKHYKSPIARFEPTGLGWDLALKFASDI